MSERVVIYGTIAWLALALACVILAATTVMTRTGVLVAFLAWLGGIVSHILGSFLWRRREARKAAQR